MGLNSERGPDDLKLMDWIFHSKSSAVLPYVRHIDAPTSNFFKSQRKAPMKHYTFANELLTQDDTMLVEQIFEFFIIHGKKQVLISTWKCTDHDSK